MLIAAPLAAAPAKAELDIVANIGVVSDYVLWGITTPGTESDGPAVQGGLDFEHSSGFYAGWWASSLGYGTDDLATTVENNLYLGFGGGDEARFFYDVGILYYWYMDASDSNAWEPSITVGYGPFSLGAAYLATDTDWGNSGDVYYTATLDFDIGLGFELGLLARHFTYENSGRFIESTAESSRFRHFDVTLSRQIADTPATMFATYTIGGRDRDGLRQQDKIVLGFTYEFGVR
jgi:uncharacterized protein (TIGR02001 family)